MRRSLNCIFSCIQMFGQLTTLLSEDFLIFCQCICERWSVPRRVCVLSLRDTTATVLLHSVTWFGVTFDQLRDLLYLLSSHEVSRLASHIHFWHFVRNIGYRISSECLLRFCFRLVTVRYRSLGQRLGWLFNSCSLQKTATVFRLYWVLSLLNLVQADSFSSPSG